MIKKGFGKKFDYSLMATLTANSDGTGTGTNTFDTKHENPSNDMRCFFAQIFTTIALSSATIAITIETADASSSDSETPGTFIKVYEGTVTSGDVAIDTNILLSDAIDVKGFAFAPGATGRFIKVSAVSDNGEVLDARLIKSSL